jgi:beta-galactosidase
MPASTPVALAHPVKGKLTLTEDQASITIQGSGFSILINKETGWISSYKNGSTEQFMMPLEPYFWRAPTDNDFGNGMPKRCDIWRNIQKEFKVKQLKSEQPVDGLVKVIADFWVDPLKSSSTVVYTIYGDGTIEVQSKFDLSKTGMPEIPRIGFRTRLSAAYNMLSYYGRGPFENYCDRNKAAFVGLYKNAVNDMFTPYSRPQECGYRTDVRWASLTNENGNGFKITASKPFGTSALNFATEDLDDGQEKDQRHPADLNPASFVEWHIDLMQMGVGGDDSWGARPHQQYMILPGVYHFEFLFQPK